MLPKSKKPSEELAEIEAKIKNIENGKNREIIAKYLEYQAMAPAQQETLLADWNRYYDLVWESKAKLRLNAMKKHFVQVRERYDMNYGGDRQFDSGKLDLLRQYAAKATEQIANKAWEVPLPYGHDPKEYDNLSIVIYYRDLKNKAAELAETVREGGANYATLSF